MLAGEFDPAALPNSDPPSYAGASTTIKLLSDLTAQNARSMKVRPNTEAEMSPAKAPVAPSATKVADNCLRGLVGGYSATLLLAPIVAVDAITLRCDCQEVLHK